MSATGQAHWRAAIATAVPFAGYSGLAMIYDALPPILVDLARHFGGGTAGQSVAQFAGTLPFFGVMVGGLASASLINRWGLRSPLLAALAAFGIMGSTGYVIDVAWQLLLTRFLLGLATGVMLTCCATYVAIRYDHVTRTRFNGWLMAWGCFTGIVFVLISGYVASAMSWRAPFLLHLVVALAFLAPALCMENLIAEREGGTRSLRDDLRELEPATPAYLTAFGLFTVQTFFFFQLTFLLSSSGFGDPTLIGRIFAITGVASTASAFAYSIWGPRFDPRHVAAVGLGMVGTGVALAALSNSLPGYALAVCVYGAGGAVTQAALFTRVMLVSSATLAPRALGLVTTSLYFGGTIGPVILAPLLWYIDLRNIFLLLASAIAVWLIGAAGRRRLLGVQSKG